MQLRCDLSTTPGKARDPPEPLISLRRSYPALAPQALAGARKCWEQSFWEDSLGKLVDLMVARADTARPWNHPASMVQARLTADNGCIGVDVNQYEASGVREYWIVDPLSKRAEVSILARGKKYQRITEKDGAIHSHVIRGLWLKTEWFWPESRPAVLTALKLLGIR